MKLPGHRRRIIRRLDNLRLTAQAIHIDVDKQMLPDVRDDFVIIAEAITRITRAIQNQR